MAVGNDELTSIFGLPHTPGVGFSFGLDRLYQILEARDLFPAYTPISTQLLLVPLAIKAESIAIQHLVQLRNKNIATELYSAGERLQKALVYADKKRIPWVLIIGEEEIQKSIFSLKHMPTRQQKSCTFQEVIQVITTEALRQKTL